MRETATFEQSVEQTRGLTNHSYRLSSSRTSITEPTAVLIRAPEVTHIFAEDAAR